MNHAARNAIRLGEAVAIVLASVTWGHSASCPAPGLGGRITFPDHSILMRTQLAVNPDGAAASYTPGDHGYTYITNGVNLHERGKKVSCSDSANTARCREQWNLAEAGAFGVGTPEFCVFAMDVEPITKGSQTTSCETDDRYIVGNGKGRPKAGKQITTVSGGTLTSYSSTTTLTHTVKGEVAYVDSAAIPGLVVPRSRSDLIGSLAWVRFGGQETFAIAMTPARRLARAPSLSIRFCIRGLWDRFKRSVPSL